MHSPPEISLLLVSSTEVGETCRFEKGIVTFETSGSCKLEGPAEVDVEAGVATTLVRIPVEALDASVSASYQEFPTQQIHLTAEVVEQV